MNRMLPDINLNGDNYEGVEEGHKQQGGEK